MKRFKFACAIFAFISSAILLATTIAGPPKRLDVIGDWVGFDDYALHFFRCELRDTGSSMALTYPGQPACLYEIKAWKLQGNEITFDVVPKNEGSYPLSLAARIDGRRLKLAVKYVDPPTTQTLSLFRETNVVSRLAEIKNVMAKARGLPKQGE
jgi:hypothetical protein